jgi:hypothetical protein
METHFKSADLHKMTVDQWQSYLVIAGLHTTQLRNKLLERQNPTFQEVKQIVTAYVATQDTGKSMDRQENPKANQAKAKGKKKGGKGTTNMPSDIKITPQFMKGRCNVCAEQGHYRDKCTKAEGAKCGNCGKDGHLTHACLGPYFRWANSKEKKEEDQKKETSGSRVRRASASSINLDEQQQQQQ